ncbi:Rcb2.42, partial [Mycena pura]
MLYEFPISGFAAAALLLVPLPWHWRARNVPTLSIIAWLLISNIIVAVNSIIWADNVNDTARVWCDITTKLQIGATMSLPACCLALCVHLERIASVRQVRTSADQKHRRMLFDLAMCWGLPIISMAFHYIVQGHRFDVVEDFGCIPTIYVSFAAVFLLYFPILLVVLLTLAFASVALYHFFRRRVTFARHLQDSSSALTPSRYFRLMAMALVQMLWSTVVTVTNMVLTLRGGLRPWISWADVHSDFGRIGFVPRVFIPDSQWKPRYFTVWAVPITAVLFFAFFAFGQDAIKEYKAFFGVLRRAARIPEKKPRVPSVPTFTPHFPAPYAKGSAGSVANTLRSSKPTSYSCDDIPLTPASASSFATVISPYDAPKDSTQYSIHKTSSFQSTADIHAMA